MELTDLNGINEKNPVQCYITKAHHLKKIIMLNFPIPIFHDLDKLTKYKPTIPSQTERAAVPWRWDRTLPEKWQRVSSQGFSWDLTKVSLWELTLFCRWYTLNPGAKSSFSSLRSIWNVWLKPVMFTYKYGDDDEEEDGELLLWRIWWLSSCETKLPSLSTMYGITISENTKRFFLSVFRVNGFNKSKMVFRIFYIVCRIPG